MIKPFSDENKEFLTPACERCYSSLLIVDISGYTRLSTRISAEQLKIHTKYVTFDH